MCRHSVASGDVTFRTHIQPAQRWLMGRGTQKPLSRVGVYKISLSLHILFSYDVRSLQLQCLLCGGMNDNFGSDSGRKGQSIPVRKRLRPAIQARTTPAERGYQSPFAATIFSITFALCSTTRCE